MSIPIVMPQLGLTMTEGTVSEWLKASGERVLKNEPLFIVSTDKADMEVESLVEGTLGQIIVQAGHTVPVGTTLAYVEGPGEDVTTAGDEQFPKTEALQETADPQLDHMTPSETVKTSLASAASRVPASPRARRLAKELGVDIAGVRGSSPEGRIVEEEDVRRAVQGTPDLVSQPNLRRRQLIAERLTRSIQTIPAFSVAVEANAEKFVSLCEGLREAVGRATGLKLTLTDMLVRALSLALKDSPEMNATWQDGGVQSRTSVDLGLAVATEQGVVAPVLRDVDGLDLRGLVARRSEMAAKARQDRLSLADLEGGTGTLSNLGMHRVDHFQAIISPGQSFILAVGKIRNRPWFDTTLVMRPTVILNLSVDHRVADGVASAVFLGKIVDLIENPYRLLWNPVPRNRDEGPQRISNA